MSNTIKLKRGSGSDPSASDLSIGEVALRTDTGQLFTKKDNNAIQEIGAESGVSDGDKGDITVSNGGDTFTIDNGVVSTAKIADDAITNAKIADNSIANAQLQDGVINTAKLATNSVSNVKIQDGVVTSAKIADSAVSTSEIDDGAVTLAKMANNSVDTNELVSGAVTNEKVNASAAIAGSKISPTFTSDLTVEHSGHPAILIHDTSGDNQCKLKFQTDSKSWSCGLHGGEDRWKVSKSDTFGTNDYLEVDSGGSLHISNNIIVGGTVDGVDIAARNTLFGGLTSSSGVLTNGVTATTQSASDNSTKVATTAYTDTAIANLVDSAPGTLNTLNELAAALGDDANFSTTVTNSIATKMPLAGGQFTGNITFSGSQTVDGRDLSVDGTKLDGIEANATADQTASEILTLLKTVDGSGSGLDADTLDGLGSGQFIRSDVTDTVSGGTKFTSTGLELSGHWFNRYYDSANAQNYIHLYPASSSDRDTTASTTDIRAWTGSTFKVLRIKGDSNDITWGGSKLWTAANDGSGSGLDSDTVDGIQASSFVRSDAADTISGDITFTDSGQYPVVIGSASGMDNGRLLLRGSSDPYIRFREGNTDKAFIQWNSSGYLRLMNQEDSSVLRIKDDIEFSPDNSTYYKMWNAYNDGSGSGLDADLLDGQEGSYYRNASNLNAGTIPAARIGSNAVTFARMQDIAEERLIGRVSSGSGDPEALTQAQVRTFLGLASSATTDTTNASNISSGTLSAARLPNNYTKAAGVVIQSTGSGNDVTIDAADHIFLESGEEEDGNIYFRGNGGADSYRFAKSGQTSIEGFLSFQSLSADRTFTFPNTTGTVALTSSNITGTSGGFTAGNASNLNSGTIPSGRVSDIEDCAARIITFDNLEKSNFNADGQLGFDSSQGLLVYRTQQGTTGTVTVLDGANVDAGTGISITNLGTGNTDATAFTFSLANHSAALLTSGTLDAARLPNHSAALLTSGTIPDARISGNFLKTNENDSILATLTIGDGSGQHELHIKKADNNVSDHLQFYNGTTRIGEIGCEDNTWLRINQETNKNIYTPRYIRADNGFFVDGTSKGINGSGNFIGGTIAGASDYGTLLRSDTADTASGDITFSGGAGAVTIAANSDIRLSNGTWSGNTTKIQHHSNYLYIVGGSAGIIFREGGTNRWIVDGSGNLDPATDSTYNIGSNSVRVANGYFDTLYGDGSNLTGISAGAQGGASDEVFWCNNQTVTANFTIPNNKNAMSAGPITINSGVTVTVGSGETWTVV